MNKFSSDQKPHSLFNRGFIALVITQFTVAFNDNAFRWLLVPIGKSYADNDMIRLLGGVFLLIPFLMWASVAGYVTDRFSRYKVIFWCKVIEFILLLAAVFVITMGPSVEAHSATSLTGFPLKIVLLLLILFLVGSQSAFFSPSKYSVIPDLVPDSSLSAANGYIAMLTMIACVSGQVVGGYVYFWTTNFQVQIVDGTKSIGAVGIPGSENIWVTAIVLLGMALLGLVSSVFIPRLKAVAPEAKFPRNPLRQTWRDLATLFSYRNLFFAATASAFFWGLAAFATNNIDKFATEYLKVPQQHVTILIAILSIGIGVGAWICGILSGKRIELGFVPFGAIGMGVIIFFLGFTPNYSQVVGEGMGDPFTHPYIFATVMMLLTGLFAGFYDVPLAAYIQRNSPQEKRGRILAASNFISFSTMIIFLSAGMVGVMVFNQLNKSQILNYDTSLLIWMSAGVLTVFIGAVLLYNLWGKFLVNAIRCILILVYRPKIIGLENVPEDGGFIIVSNHISLLDGMLLAAIFPRKIRFLAFEPLIPKWFEPLVRETGLIKLTTGKRAVIAIRAAREGLGNGDIIGIFPEGGITRNSQMRQFESGFLSILKGNPEAPIVPVYIHGLFGSMFSYKYGDKPKFAPKILPTGVVIAFGKPICNPSNTLQVQIAVQELGAEICCEPSRKRHPIPARALIRSCKRRKFAALFGEHDDNGGTISGGRFLELALILRRLMNVNLLGKRQKETNVGILLPTSIPSAIVNATIAIDRRTSINLDCNHDTQTFNQIIRDAKIKHVITSNKFFDLSQIAIDQIDAKVIFIEEILEKATLLNKLSAKFQSLICPRLIVEMKLGLVCRSCYEEIATIIYGDKFIAGNFATGTDNHSAETDNTANTIVGDDCCGVRLSNSNLAEAGRGFNDALRLNKNDVILGTIPFSQPLGYTGVFWATFFSGGACLLSNLNKLTAPYAVNILYPSCFEIPEAEHASVASQSGCSGAKPAVHTGFGINSGDGCQVTHRKTGIDANELPIPVVQVVYRSSRSAFYNFRKCLLPSDVTFWATDLSELGVFVSAVDVGGSGFDFGRFRTVICGVGVGDGGEESNENTVKIFDQWESKFGTRPTTGFWATDFVLFAALNVPASRRIDDFHIYCKEGTVGRAIAGVAIKTINPETGENSKPNETGLLTIKSPTTPNQPKQKNIWYRTKLKAKIDNDGFLTVEGIF
ncbi:MAG: MFS transporter [Planctomycetaceae bacterium]|jgi:acyl-[acyl-carrier-protein]-phospholipid O-acyltransferase/long-chain-fatty-acid--[acyl-carrier-protein] ligase|nr:MFS transporter [Planctomycetaceae bacterium]